MCIRDSVSVPLRGTTFLNNFLITKKWKILFPSPYGELHFSIWNINYNFIWLESFRPLTGNYISQLISVWCKCYCTLFPSPYGELHFSMEPIRGRIGRHPWFPSPYGELHFSIIFEASVTAKNSFRPLTGNYISQCGIGTGRRWTSEVSVPLRGTTFLNTISHTPYILWLICPKCVWKNFLRNVVSWNPK